MFLVDVNVLVYAHRGDTPNHPRYRRWLESIVNADSAYGMSDLVVGESGEERLRGKVIPYSCRIDYWIGS